MSFATLEDLQQGILHTSYEETYRGLDIAVGYEYGEEFDFYWFSVDEWCEAEQCYFVLVDQLDEVCDLEDLPLTSEEAVVQARQAIDEYLDG